MRVKLEEELLDWIIKQVCHHHHHLQTLSSVHQQQ